MVIASVATQVWAFPAQAQTLLPDGSLPTQVGRDVASEAFTVTGGSAQGSNLFHSFDTFSPGDWSVLFDLSGESFGNNIERIFSHVTGTSISEINGSLSILGSNAPDLFLLNPNGILFGPNARLNLPGSFVGTTAESIRFADGSRFGTVSPTSEASLLSISVPTGLQFGQNPGAISVLGNGHNLIIAGTLAPRIQNPAIPPAGLTVAPGTTFALLGGPVNLRGAELQSPYQALPDGVSILGIPSVPIGQIQVEVGAVASGVVQLQEQSGGWSFDYSGINDYRDIEMTQRSLLNGGGIIPGRINLLGRYITVDEGSTATVYNWGSSLDSKASGIRIQASELLKIQGNTAIDSNISTAAIAPQKLDFGPSDQDAGPISVFSKNLQILDGASINSTVFGIGNGGQLTIEVQDSLLINGQTAPNLRIPRRTGIGANTFATGNVGNISIKTNDLFLNNGGSILSTSIGTGSGGRVDINASGQVTVQEFNPLPQLNSFIASVSLREGDAGEGVFIRAKQLNILNGGRISSSAFGSGDTGDITLNILDSIRIGGFDSATSQEPAGIEAAVINNSVATAPFAKNNGNVRDGGSIKIQSSNQVELFDGGRISVTNEGGEQAGNITIQTDSLTLLDRASISAITTIVGNKTETGDGDGGNLRLLTNESILLRRGSQVSVSSESKGIGGNIRIQTPFLVAIPQENSDITANSVSNFGGNIRLDATSVLGIAVQPQETAKSDITASSRRGPQFSGTVELLQPQIRPNERLAELPSRFADQSDRLAQSCDAGSSQQLSITSRRSLTQVDPEAQALSQQYGDRGYDDAKRQQWQQAQQNFLQALQISEAAQNPFQSYQWAWQLARIAQAHWQYTGSAQFRTEALAYYQESLNALKELRSDLANRDQAAEFSFRSNIEPVYREYVSLLLPSQTQTAIPTKDLQAALDTIEALKLAELDNFFQDACLNRTPRSIKALDNKAAVVYPIVLDDRLEVIISHQGTLQRHSIPIPPDDFQAMIRDFRSSLAQRSSRNYQQSGQQLYDVLLRPILTELRQSQIQTLVFVPDKSLKNVPMGALFDGQEYLIEQFNVVVAPGLELLPGGSRTTTNTRALLAGITKRHQGFPPLPYVQQELEELQSLFPGEQLINEGFTQATLTKSLRETQTSIVHIATHGQFSSDASETFVLAWNEKIYLEQLYELLQARDRDSLTPTELLVLSACETAFGDEAAALGLAGVAVRAGARSTLASLWSVNDQSTAFLMKTFYEQLSQGNGNKSAALRQAQLELLQHPTYRHPYYWSAFVLIGNWQ